MLRKAIQYNTELVILFDEEIHLASEPADGLGSLTMGGNPERSETEVRIG